MVHRTVNRNPAQRAHDPHSQVQDVRLGRSQPIKRTAPASGNTVDLPLGNLPVFAGGPPPVIQTKSVEVGPAGDAYEQEADRMADLLTRSGSEPTRLPSQRPTPLLHSPSGVLHRKAESGAPAPASVSSLPSSGSGDPLPPSIQQEFGQKLDADLSGVRVHTDAQSQAWNQSLSARAFASGQDIYFGKGQYQPSTLEGRRVLAHELTHVGQQNPGLLGTSVLSDPSRAIRPLRINPKDQKYYSDVAPGLHSEYCANTTEDSFLTATSNAGRGGGHTTIYIEYFKQSGSDYVPSNLRVELFLGARGQGISISIKNYSSQDMQAKLFDLGSPLKKTWKKKREDAEKAVTKAEEIQKNQANYTYYKLGRGPTLKNDVLNCARFGQRVLQAAGIDVHIGSAKLPSRITDPTKRDGAISKVYTSSDLKADATSSLPDYCRKRSEFLTAVKRDPHDSSGLALAAAGGFLYQYHQHEETLLRAPALAGALDQVRDYVKAASIQEFLAQRSDASATSPGSASLKFIREELYPALCTEVERLKQEVDADLKSIDDAKASRDEHAKIGGRLDTALDQLAELMTHATSKDLVTAKVRQKFSSSGSSADKKIKQILEQGEHAAIIGNWG